MNPAPAAQSIANNPQANAMTAGGKKAIEDKMTYLSTIHCERYLFPLKHLEI